MIATRTSRRGFLSRSALVGSALATVPATYVLRPGTAYGAICTCNNTRCDCGDLCCDGYTEFCCTMTGENTCPAGSVPAGWWKVDGSSFCVRGGSPGPRYYLDCNAVPAGPCGASGVTPLTDLCDCECSEGDCTNRKACCTAFRYGQCNQQIACLGPIVCRVVTCTPPWRFDPTCTTATATDNNTRWHHRPCLERPTPERGSLPATFNDGVWVLGYELGARDDVPLETFTFGKTGDIPVVGDWNGDGTHTIGVVRGNRWLLRNENSAGPPDLDFVFGEPGDIPVVGDWTGSGRTGIGMRAGAGSRWKLRNTATPGKPEKKFRFGAAGDIPIAGDWTGNGMTGIGVIRPDARAQAPTTQWLLRKRPSGGPAQRSFFFGPSGVKYVVGDWTNTGRDRPGFVKPGGRWRFRGVPSPGMRFGNQWSTPLVWQASDWTPGQMPRLPK